MSVVAYSLCRGMGNLMVHLMVLYSWGGGLSVHHCSVCAATCAVIILVAG